MPSRLDPVTAGLDANQAHVLIVHESVEDAHGVAAAAHARHNCVRKSTDRLETLRSGLPADDGLELANHERIRMRSEHRSEQIVTVRYRADPVPHGFVDGVLQRAAAGIDAADGGAEKLHAKDVERLPRHVFGAHVDVAVETEQRTGCCRGHAVLPRPGLRDHPPLPHPPREEGLTDGVVDLVRACMRQILSFEENASAAGPLTQPDRFVERRRSTDVIAQQPSELVAESLVVARGEVRAFELGNWGDERLRHESPAISAVVTAGIRVACPKAGIIYVSNAAKSARNRSGSLTPGADSTPDDTSIPNGRTVSIAVRTFSGRSPPASNTRRRRRGGRRPAPVNGGSCSAVALGIVRIQQDASAGGYPVDG